MTISIPKWLRGVLYLTVIVGTPVVTYAQAKGWIGPLEVNLFKAEVIVAGTVATLHLGSSAAIPADVDVTDTDPDVVDEEPHETPEE